MRSLFLIINIVFYMIIVASSVFQSGAQLPSMCSCCVLRSALISVLVHVFVTSWASF